MQPSWGGSAAGIRLGTQIRSVSTTDVAESPLSLMDPTGFATIAGGAEVEWKLEDPVWGGITSWAGWPFQRNVVRVTTEDNCLIKDYSANFLNRSRLLWNMDFKVLQIDKISIDDPTCAKKCKQLQCVQADVGNVWFASKITYVPIPARIWLQPGDMACEEILCQTDRRVLDHKNVGSSVCRRIYYTRYLKWRGKRQ